MLRNILVVLVFGAAAIIGVWDLLQIEAVDSALLQFATAGVVPGTGVILTPGQVYVSLCVILLLVVCLLFRKSLIRDWHDFRRSAFSSHTVDTSAPRTSFAAATVQQESRTSSAPRTSFTPITPPAPQQVPASLAPTPVLDPASSSRPAVIITIPATPGVLVRSLRAITAWLKPASGRAWRSIKTRSRQDAKLLIKLFNRYRREAWRAMVRAWRYTEPRIREIDAYIELQLKSNHTASRMLREAEYIHRQVATRINSWRAKVQRPVEK
jgi:hypothetical protein